jgi:hypothetical protein
MGGYSALGVPVGNYSGSTTVIQITPGVPLPPEIRQNYQMIGQSIFLVSGNYNQTSLSQAGASVGADIVFCWRQNLAAGAMFFRHK